MKLYRQQLFIEVSSHWELVTSTFLVIDRSCNNKFVTTELVVHCRKSQVTYAVTGMKTYKNVNCVQKIKCVKVRALFPENKVRFARAEQVLWFSGAPVGWMMKCTCIATVRNGGVEWTTADDAGINPPPPKGGGWSPRHLQSSTPLHHFAQCASLWFRIRAPLARVLKQSEHTAIHVGSMSCWTRMPLAARNVQLRSRMIGMYRNRLKYA